MRDYICRIQLLKEYSITIAKLISPEQYVHEIVDIPFKATNISAALNMSDQLIKQYGIMGVKSITILTDAR